MNPGDGVSATGNDAAVTQGNDAQATEQQIDSNQASEQQSSGDAAVQSGGATTREAAVSPTPDEGTPAATTDSGDVMAATGEGDTTETFPSGPGDGSVAAREDAMQANTDAGERLAGAATPGTAGSDQDVVAGNGPVPRVP